MDPYPKVVGVSFQSQRKCWVTHFMENGKAKHRSFSVAKYGFEEAYHKAVQRRIEYLNTVNKKPKVLFEQSLDLLPSNLSALESLEKLNNWANLDTLDKLINEEPVDAKQKELKLLKTALHCILVDLQHIYPRHNLDVIDTIKFESRFRKQIVDVWKSKDVEELKPLLDIYNELFQTQKLPCLLDTHCEDLDQSVADHSEVSESDPIADSRETFQYQTEVTRLLDIIVNSIYTNKEIFIRELISNASDALEKARLSELKSNEPSHDLSIRISFDDSSISIVDTGIGMSKDDLVNNLGTIAKSGTKSFLEALQSTSDVNLIGQFGVGFYSSFLVSDRVVVQSKRHGFDQYVWESSSSDSSFKVYKDPEGDTLPRGTRVTLFLKEDAKNYLDFDDLKTLIDKYNSFIPHPIYLYGKPKAVPKLSFGGKEFTPDNITVTGSDGQTKPEDEAPEKWVLLNDKQPLWLRDPKEIKQEEYNEFYKSISGDHEDPLATIHFRGEGDLEFKALLFIPAKPPSEFLDYSRQTHNVKLYIKRVLVSLDLPNFIPKYLFNIVGIVDSEDMSLNISRETIQHNEKLTLVSKKITKKILDKINQLKIEDESHSDPDKPSTFAKFWKAFQGSLKIGCYEDNANRNKILDLLQFSSLKHSDGKLTLAKYIKEAGEDNKTIYYASGESYGQLENMPQIQIFKKKGIDVLFLFDSIDESCISRSYTYKDFSFKSIQKGNVDLGDSDKDRNDYYQKVFTSFQADLKDVLAEVYTVQYNDKLLDSPCAVQATEWGMSAQMERSMKSYTVNKLDKNLVVRNKVFQINPEHPLILRLLDIHTNDGKSDEFVYAAKLIYNTAKLASGFIIENSENVSEAAYTFLSNKISAQADTLENLVERNEKLKEAVEKADEAKDEKDSTQAGEDLPLGEDFFNQFEGHSHDHEHDHSHSHDHDHDHGFKEYEFKIRDDKEGDEEESDKDEL